MSRILVVDDDAVAVRGLTQLLEMDGHEAVGLLQPELALVRLRAEAFDVLVTDLEMPGVHGLELVRAAREAQPGLAVVVVTAYDHSPAGASALALGARRVLGKPLHYEELLAELEALGEPGAPLTASR